jgi:hypothetical protein
VAYPLGFKIVKRDISRHFFQIGANRLDQSQMGLKAQAIQVPQKRDNHSLRSPAAEVRHEKQNSFARCFHHQGPSKVFNVIPLLG